MPYGGKAANLKRSAAKLRKILLGRLDVIPIYMPAMYQCALDDSVCSERERAMVACLDIIERVDEVWIFGKTISPGMELEIEYARKHGIPVIYPEGRK